MLAASAPDCAPPPAEVQDALDLAAEQSLGAGQFIKRLRGAQRHECPTTPIQGGLGVDAVRGRGQGHSTLYDPCRGMMG